MLRVSEIMTKDVFTLDPDLSLRTALEEFSKRGIHGAPVLAGAEVVGVCSLTDIVEFTTSAPDREKEGVDWGDGDTALLDEESDPSERYFVEMWEDRGGRVAHALAAPETYLDDHVVREVMTRGAYNLDPDAAVNEAARLMVAGGVHRLLVMHGKRLAGILSAWDIMRAVADQRL